MEGATGTMEIKTGHTRETYSWNGNDDDRARARAVFHRMLTIGGALATVWDAPHTGHQVRSFAEVEQVERERGTVRVTITPQVRGG